MVDSDPNNFSRGLMMPTTTGQELAYQIYHQGPHEFPEVALTLDRVQRILGPMVTLPKASSD